MLIFQPILSHLGAATFALKDKTAATLQFLGLEERKLYPPKTKNTILCDFLCENEQICRTINRCPDCVCAATKQILTSASWTLVTWWQSLESSLQLTFFWHVCFSTSNFSCWNAQFEHTSSHPHAASVLFSLCSFSNFLTTDWQHNISVSFFELRTFLYLT